MKMNKTELDILVTICLVCLICLLFIQMFLNIGKEENRDIMIKDCISYDTKQNCIWCCNNKGYDLTTCLDICHKGVG